MKFQMPHLQYARLQLCDGFASLAVIVVLVVVVVVVGPLTAV